MNDSLAALGGFELTQRTLSYLFVIPILYCFFQYRYWYDHKRLKNIDFLFLCPIIIVLSLIIYQSYNASKLLTSADIELILQHIGVLIISLLLIGIFSGMLLLIPKSPKPEKARKNDIHHKSIEAISWDHVIIPEGLKGELQTVIKLLKDPKSAQSFGIEVPKGIILCGPPGTGKTTIARVIASTANLNFFVLSLDEVISKWVGESEKNLTALFNAAQQQKPAVIFIDEIDSIGKVRGESVNTHGDTLLNHLLQLVDGIIKLDGVYIIGATNRPELVDPALSRAGRLSKIIRVPVPDAPARLKLFSLYLSRLKLAENINLHQLAIMTEGATGADIKEICNQAALNAFRRCEAIGAKKKELFVVPQDIELALIEYRR